MNRPVGRVQANPPPASQASVPGPGALQELKDVLLRVVQSPLYAEANVPPPDISGYLSHTCALP